MLGTEAEVAAALQALDGDPHPVAAAEWPAELENIDLPGLYSWWVDAAGAVDLSRGLGLLVEPTRIYAGLTGATKWPSGATGKNTLRKRVGGNHIRGRVRGSTFRFTLAAILLDALSLDVTEGAHTGVGGGADNVDPGAPHRRGLPVPARRRTRRPGGQSARSTGSTA